MQASALAHSPAPLASRPVQSLGLTGTQLSRGPRQQVGGRRLSRSCQPLAIGKGKGEAQQLLPSKPASSLPLANAPMMIKVRPAQDSTNTGRIPGLYIPCSQVLHAGANGPASCSCDPASCEGRGQARKRWRVRTPSVAPARCQSCCPTEFTVICRSMSDLEERGFVSDDRKMGNGAMQGMLLDTPCSHLVLHETMLPGLMQMCTGVSHIPGPRQAGLCSA